MQMAIGASAFLIGLGVHIVGLIGAVEIRPQPDGSPLTALAFGLATVIIVAAFVMGWPVRNVRPAMPRLGGWAVIAVGLYLAVTIALSGAGHGATEHSGSYFAQDLGGHHPISRSQYYAMGAGEVRIGGAYLMGAGAVFVFIARLRSRVPG